MKGNVSVWTNPTTHSTGSTTNTGPTIDLYTTGVPAGGTYDGTGLFGIGVEILQTLATGTAQVTAWEWETSADASTWRKGGFIGLGTMDGSQADDIARLKSTLRTRHRYCRLLATNSGTGTSTSKAYAEDTGGLFGQSVALA